MARLAIIDKPGPDRYGSVVVSGNGTPKLDGESSEQRLFSALYGTAPEGEVVIEGRVKLDQDVTVDKLTIPQGTELYFDKFASVTLRSRGNIILHGKLRMTPNDATVIHKISFIEIDETKFVGGHPALDPHHPGHHDIPDTDVGLWVHHGDCVFHGTPKKPWTHLTGSINAGDTSFTVVDATGWRVGDRLAITPTLPPTTSEITEESRTFDDSHASAYDEVYISAIDGNTISFTTHVDGSTGGLKFDHPEVTSAEFGKTWRAEVLNLSRNVIIEGQGDVRYAPITNGGRAHIHIGPSGGAQHWSYVEVRKMGPRRIVDNKTDGILARYGVHFHLMQDQSRGTLLDGVVVHTCGSHSFVPHESHGVTMYNCISHDNRGEAYWWDPSEKGNPYTPVTLDTVYDTCVASLVKPPVSAGSSELGFRIGAFFLGAGDGNTERSKCINCVAVGVQPWRQSSGFDWPETSRGIWVFEDCLAHNCAGAGVFTWQNDERVHFLDRFTAYYCGNAGIDHGAYSNFWIYEDAWLYGNRFAGLSIHATTRRTGSTPPDAPRMSFINMFVDGAGISKYGIKGDGHRLAAPDNVPVDIIGCKIANVRTASFYMFTPGNREEYWIENCEFEFPEFWLDDHLAREQKSGSTVVVQGSWADVKNLNGSGEFYRLRQKDEPYGLAKPEWNCKKEDL